MDFKIIHPFVKNNSYYYRCICEKCNNVKNIRRDRFDSAQCNALIHTHRDIAKLLFNTFDAYKYSHGSTKKATWQCPNCGLVFKRAVNQVVRRGLVCPMCSDGISYPNRYMYSLLSYYNIDFQREVVFEWSNGKRYDFYIPEYSMIIEMNGLQHYDNTTLYSIGNDIEENDKYKRMLAIKHGIKHYVEIDARKSESDYISESIKSSIISNFIKFTDEDLCNISMNAEKSLVSRVIEKRNDGLLTTEIAKDLKVSEDYVSSVLQRANKLGLCNYDKKYEKMKFLSYAHEAHKKKVICINTQVEYESVNEAAEKNNITPKALSNCLTGRCKSCGKDAYTGQKLYWKYKE